MRRFNILILVILLLQMTTSLAAGKNCPEGTFWDTTANRCMITLKNAQTKHESTRCQGLSGDAFKECFNDNANSRVSELESEGTIKEHEQSFNKNNGVKIAVPLAISLLTGYYLFLNKDKFKDCKNTSLWLLFGGGLVSFVGEMSAQITYKSKTKDLEDEYKEKMKEYEREDKYGIMTHNQTMAFDYLIEAEEGRQTAEKVRKGAYTMAALLYTGAAAMAIVETIQVGASGNSCNVKTSKNNAQKHYDNLRAIQPEFSGYSYIENMTYSELVEIIARKLYSKMMPIQIAQANTIRDPQLDCQQSGGYWDPIDEECKDNSNSQNENNTEDESGTTDETDVTQNEDDETPGFDAENLGNIGDNLNVTKNLEKMNSELFNSSAKDKHMNAMDNAVANTYVRAGLASVLALYANKLRKDAKDAIAISEKRVEAIKKIRDDFVATGGAGGFSMCKDEDRDDKSKPHCFCYDEDGALDKRKSQLSVCLKVSKQRDFLGSSDYGWDSGPTTPTKVCVNEDNEMDTFCKCKNKKSKSGKGNACVKVSSSLNLSGLGGNSWVKGITTPADSLLNGNIDGSQLDTTALGRKSMALKKQLDKMRKKPKYKKAMKKMDDYKAKLQKAHKNWYKKSFGDSVPASLASNISSGGASAPTSVDDIVKQAKETMKKSKATSYASAGSDSATGDSKKDSGLDFDWGSEGSKGGVQIDDVAKVMDKNYNYKGDINKNPSHNIFKILSLRYQRSGLRRLFDTEGKAKADEANETDIHQK